jgi:hypothetical protein
MGDWAWHTPPWKTIAHRVGSYKRPFTRFSPL